MKTEAFENALVWTGLKLSQFISKMVFCQFEFNYDNDIFRSSSIFFSVKLPCKGRIKPVAVISGGALIIHALNKSLTMNGSLSFDHETGNNEGMNFIWYYGKIKGQNKSIFQLLPGDLLPAVNDFDVQDLRSASGRVITIDSNYVRNTSETLVVNLTVGKNSCSSRAYQIVYFVKGDRPEISQR